MSAPDCPAWCTGEHGCGEHDGTGHGTHDDVCILTTAEFGSEEAPNVLAMLGPIGTDAGFSLTLTPNQTRALHDMLIDPNTLEDTVCALRAVLREVAA